MRLQFHLFRPKFLNSRMSRFVSPAKLKRLVDLFTNILLFACTQKVGDSLEEQGYINTFKAETSKKNHAGLYKTTTQVTPHLSSGTTTN